MKRKKSRSKHLYAKRIRPSGITPEADTSKYPTESQDAMGAEMEVTRDIAVQQFEAYYRAQRIIPDEEEFVRLLRCLYKPLPISFRVSAVTSRQLEVEAAMTQGRPFLHDAVQTRVDGLTVFKPVYFGWCGAWQLGCDDRLIRQASKQDKTSHLAQLQRWIAQHTANGVITRQEIVSMAPVALLQIKPEHRVLDVCASPGSKTTQALEALHASEEHSPRGFVVANELVDKRSYLLSNRCAALGSACRRLMVTSHRAQIFPQFDKSCAGEYDRIICDVPCSGDGTFRKYRDKWGHWLPHMGRGLHSLQLQIAIRAIGLLK
eukprot:gene27736-34244_t